MVIDHPFDRLACGSASCMQNIYLGWGVMGRIGHGFLNAVARFKFIFSVLSAVYC